MWLSGGWELDSGTRIEELVQARTRKSWCGQDGSQQELRGTKVSPWTKVTAGLDMLPEHSWIGMIDSVIRGWI